MKHVPAISLILTFAFSASKITLAQQTEGLKIAFNVLEDQKADNYDVYVMSIDGSASKNITNHKDVAWTYYAWRNKLYFVSDRDACRRCYFLHESDADGKNIRKVSNLQLEDSWMGTRNNGSEMIVAGRIGTTLRYQLFVIDIATGRFRQLTNEPAAAFRDPTFSPDGKKIAYVYKKNRTNRSEIEELYVMNANETKRKKLTTYPAADPMAKEPGYKVGPPHWNAKHKFITYQSEQGGKSSIYAVTPDGKKQWKLTSNAHTEGWHDWSPDGNWLAFDARDAASGRYDIFLMNYATKEVKKLTGESPMKYHQSPVFVEVQRPAR
jgi:TolB protein